MSRLKWTQERCLEIAKSCRTSHEMAEKSKGALNAARMRGWFKEYTWFEDTRHMNWTYDEAYEIAKTCHSRSELQRKNASAYKIAKREGWIDDYTWFERPDINRVWTKEMCAEISRLYKTPHEFELGNPNAYNASLRNKWISEFTWLERKKKEWSREDCYLEAQRFEYYHDFCKNSSGSAYAKALKEGWLSDYTWLKPYEPKRKWNRDLCFEIGRSYIYKSDFQKYDKGAYLASRKYGWLKEMDWFIPKAIEKFERTQDDYKVYVYLDEDSKVCYVGLTIDVRKRHSRHKNGRSPVYDYFYSKDIPIPYPRVLKTHLTSEEAQYYEDFYIKDYKEKGWTLLNTGATGVGVGSLGGVTIKYTREVAENIAKCYDNLKDFRIEQPSCYSTCTKNKWIKDFTWLEKYHNVKRWTYLEIREIAQKYERFSDFQKGDFDAWAAAHNHGWLGDFDWLVKGREIKWTHENCEMESHKYSSLKEFRESSPSCYNACQKKGWLKEFTWLEMGHVSPGYWTVESAIEISKTCSTISEVRKKYSAAYNILCKNNLIDSLPWLKRERNKNGYWSHERIIQEASKYQTLSDFAANSPTAHSKACSLGMLDELDFLEKKCLPNGYWTEERIMAEAKQYRTLSELKEKSPKCYSAAGHRKLYPKMTWMEHPKHPNGYWTEEVVRRESKHYKNVTEFMNLAKGGYNAARKFGILKELEFGTELE